MTLRILAVDDSRTMRDMLTMALTAAGMDVDQGLAEAFFHLVDAFPGQFVGDIEQLRRAADRSGDVDRFQQAHPPLAEHDLAVDFGPEVGFGGEGYHSTTEQR